jgi:hypothetical protein
VATDDSHKDAHIGRAWIEVSAARNPDAILRAVKAGDFVPGFGSRGIAGPSPALDQARRDALKTFLRRNR